MSRQPLPRPAPGRPARRPGSVCDPSPASPANLASLALADPDISPLARKEPPS
jgi:hypothetical protein